MGDEFTLVGREGGEGPLLPCPYILAVSLSQLIDAKTALSSNIGGTEPEPMYRISLLGRDKAVKRWYYRRKSTYGSLNGSVSWLDSL